MQKSRLPGFGKAGFCGRFPIMDFYLQECGRYPIFGVAAPDLQLVDVGKLDTLGQAEEMLKKIHIF